MRTLGSKDTPFFASDSFMSSTKGLLQPFRGMDSVIASTVSSYPSRLRCVRIMSLGMSTMVSIPVAITPASKPINNMVIVSLLMRQ